ncbi:GNAT family N-acetyltransferase [Longispora urticae]
MPLIHWGPDDLLHRLDDVLAVYGAAMAYPRDLIFSRRSFVASHAGRPGFRAVATLDDDGALLGFGYGYTSSPGQWWHEQVRGALPRPVYHGWMDDCFELVELHVAPGAQGHGSGHRQLVALLTGVPRGTVLLSTPEVPREASRAWRLYRRLGFLDVLRNFHFPGDERPFAVLGRSLPLDRGDQAGQGG